MAAPNAIEQRLALLSDQWNEFATNEDARVLRWLVQDDELRVIEAFVASEQDERAGDTPDLFLRFTDAFTDVDGYGASLLASLLAEYEAAQPDLAESGIDATWSPPDAAGRHSLIVFLDACISVQRHYADSMERLALVLTPDTVSSDHEFARWLWAIAERLPADVRIAVLDSVSSPVLETLATTLPGRVVTTEAALDMPAAIASLARSGGTRGPDGQFRVVFTKMTQTLAKPDVDGAAVHADAASAIAKENGWLHLDAAVNLAMAGGFLSAGRHAEALEIYQRADSIGTATQQSDEELGAKLKLQAGLGVCSVYFAASDFAGAARLYEQTSAQAEASGDTLMQMECWRMSGYCHEQAGDATNAWAAGVRALDTAATMSDEDRHNSTLPFAGEGLIRIAGHSQQHAQYIDARMTELMGTNDWRAIVAAATAGTK
jgi:tetratricopeptide (TPR) repeat protein